VVWVGWEGNDIELFGWNGGDPFQITDNEVHDEEAAVSNGQVVWVACEGVLVESEFDEECSTDTEIYIWDEAGGERRFVGNTLDDEDPRISNGKVVWEGEIAGGGEAIFYKKDETPPPIQLTNPGTLYDDTPDISGNNIVWASCNGEAEANPDFPDEVDCSGNYEVFGEGEWFSGSTVGMISDPTSGSSVDEVRVDGAEVAWTAQWSGPRFNAEVFYWSGSGDPIQLTNDGFHKNDLAISGGKVVWVSGTYDENFTNYRYKIFLWENGVTTELLSSPYLITRVDIDGTTVVWDEVMGEDATDDYLEDNFEIYRATLAPVTAPLPEENAPEPAGGVLGAVALLCLAALRRARRTH